MDRDFLKRTLAERNIGSVELAKKAEIGQATVSEIINGVRKDVKLSTAKKIADALDVSLEKLCGEE